MKKSPYLCTRLNEATTFGALVQLVRIHACHAWGHGFESRTHRRYREHDIIMFFFIYI